jgi:hypothetical protein
MRPSSSPRAGECLGLHLQIAFAGVEGRVLLKGGNCRGPFGQTRRNFTALNGPKYKPRGLQSLLDQYFESDPLLDRALTGIVIPVFDTKLQQPIIFSSWQVSALPSMAFLPFGVWWSSSRF